MQIDVRSVEPIGLKELVLDVQISGNEVSTCGKAGEENGGKERREGYAELGHRVKSAGQMTVGGNHRLLARPYT